MDGHDEDSNGRRESRKHFTPSLHAAMRGMIKRGQRERNAYCLIGAEREQIRQENGDVEGEIMRDR